MLEMLHRDVEEQTTKRVGNRVLVVEDDEATAYALRDGLEYEGYSVLVATDGNGAVRLADVYSKWTSRKAPSSRPRGPTRAL